ncbi:MAG: tRNA (adenosine(37)-N6)-threonylcarbamoyltransferase complex ATPase subunit type 1 TsaE [Burkholderiales bacterium]|nr:tRNA (adenosine(37)-N6)-threonylcarbamoyltransferase complex ATPase subunit type 1 TsaE [Burkholderiales bacterium]
MKSLARDLADEPATLALGAALAPGVRPGLVIFLRGDLGAGKTTLARGLLRGLGYGGRVKSPTYTLAELYNVSNLCLYHFDFYRLEYPEEWADAGFRECFGGDRICVVEWPERAGDTLPAPDLEIELTVTDEGRHVRLRARSIAGQRCLEALSG